MATAALSAPRLIELVDRYAAISTLPGEPLMEGLMNNMMIESHMANPKIEAAMQSLNNNLDGAEQSIVKKQMLLAQIYRQALVELRGPGSETALRHLLLAGLAPGRTEPSLPGVERLSSMPVLFELLEGLVRRETDVALIALDILRLRGPRYPSTDSFSRGLARFASDSSAEAALFDRVLNTFELLHKLRDAHPIPRGEPSSARVHLGQISRELPHSAYNPAIDIPHLRSSIVSNLITQISKRTGTLRADLVESLIKIHGDARVGPFAEKLLRTSENALDLRAAFRAVSGRNGNQKLIRQIAGNLKRYAAIPSADDKAPTVLAEAIRAITMPFDNAQPDKARPQRRLALGLLKHARSEIRRQALPILRSEVFSDAEVERFTHTLLADPAEIVRMHAIDSFWSVTSRAQGHRFLDALENLSQRDSSEKVRKFATETRAHVLKETAYHCSALFYSR